MPLLLSLILFGAETCPLSADFILATVVKERNTTEKEVVKGDLYVLESGTVILAVTSPVNQIMWIKKDTTDIYYPQEGKLFRILTRDSFPDNNTNVSRLLNFDFENRLRRAGLKVEATEKRGDTSILIWGFKQKPANLKIEIETGRIGEDFILYRTRAKGTKLEFQFRDFRDAGGKRVPHLLRSLFISRKFSRMEDLRLGKIRTGEDLPEDLNVAEFPSETEIKTVHW